jgi:biopolymer transport protein ExbD
MAGIDGGGGKGRRRSLDSEINMVPMIDLLMVTISFLLITAVWVHSKRLESTAQAPGVPTDRPTCEVDCVEEAKLHVDTSDPSKFLLAWKQGRTVLRSVDVPRERRKNDRVAYPSLAAKIAEEWRAAGLHREATDRSFDRAVVHAANEMSYAELVAVMDAVAEQKRPYAAGDKVLETSAFLVTLAAD